MDTDPGRVSSMTAINSVSRQRKLIRRDKSNARESRYHVVFNDTTLHRAFVRVRFKLCKADNSSLIRVNDRERVRPTENAVQVAKNVDRSVDVDKTRL